MGNIPAKMKLLGVAAVAIEYVEIEYFGWRSSKTRSNSRFSILWYSVDQEKSMNSSAITQQTWPRQQHQKTQLLSHSKLHYSGELAAGGPSEMVKLVPSVSNGT